MFVQQKRKLDFIQTHKMMLEAELQEKPVRVFLFFTKGTKVPKND